MEMVRRWQRGLGVVSVLLSGALACSNPDRRFDENSGAAGQEASGGGSGASPVGTSGKLESGSAGVSGAIADDVAGGGPSAAGDGSVSAGQGGMAHVAGSGGSLSGSGGSVSIGGAAGHNDSAGGAASAGCGAVSGCTSAVCGDNVLQSASEQCDDGNTTTEACTYGVKSCTVCNTTCKTVAGAVSYCGDSAIRSGYETCDDGNAATESCTYGQASCSVCDATCHSVAGAISYCGDAVRQAAHEACDNGTANSINGNCSPTCTTCDKIAGTEPVTYDDSSWTGGLSFTVTKATTLYQFKVYHNDSSYQLNLYLLSAPDTAPAADAVPVWKLPTSTPKASTFDTINVSLALSAGSSYLLTTVGQVMSIAVPNPAVAYPVQSLSGIKVTKSFSVQDTLELNQGNFRTTSWGPFTDLRACLQLPI